MFESIVAFGNHEDCNHERRSYRFARKAPPSAGLRPGPRGTGTTPSPQRRAGRYRHPGPPAREQPRPVLRGAGTPDRRHRRRRRQGRSRLPLQLAAATPPVPRRPRCTRCFEPPSASWPLRYQPQTSFIPPVPPPSPRGLGSTRVGSNKRRWSTTECRSRPGSGRRTLQLGDSNRTRSAVNRNKTINRGGAVPSLRPAG